MLLKGRYIAAKGGHLMQINSRFVASKGCKLRL